MLASHSADGPRPGALLCSQDLASSADAAFALVCEVEKWPVWLSPLRSARRLQNDPLEVGSQVAVRAVIPGDDEELYEVDQFLPGYIMSLVGAYSLRRRIDFRIERKSDRSKLVVRLDYPAYGGVLGALLDRVTVRRRLEHALEDSLVHFKGLVEFDEGPQDELLADF
ncbi:MAG: SRPBCC family protein [Candidatus Eremiobacteraeota bacterium]|nr:SRPBCC family protein [Candidatus Eremiobacteraeota bacterium]